MIEVFNIFEKFLVAQNTNELISQLNDYRMLETEIKYLTGYDIRGLRDFLAGCSDSRKFIDTLKEGSRDSQEIW